MANPDADASASTPSSRILALTSGLGCSIFVLLIAATGGGIYLDRQLDSTPAFTITGVVIGLALAAVLMIWIVRVSRERAAQAPFPRSSRPDLAEEEDDWGRPRHVPTSPPRIDDQ